MLTAFLPFFHIGIFAFLISVAFSGYMVSAGLGDVPVSRSNHEVITPTAGGIGLLAGLGTALLIMQIFYADIAVFGELFPIAVLAGCVALIGLTDDMLTWPAPFKVFTLAVVSGVAAYLIGPITALPFSVITLSLPLPIAIAGTALWIFVVMNGVNFMDGANGFMPGVIGLSGLILCGLCVIYGASGGAILSIALCSGLFGLLPYNFKTKADIFSGDVGALLAGFLFATASLKLAHAQPNFSLLYIGPVLLLPFLTDVFLTMLRRAKNRENLLGAHRSHLYQRMISQGVSHTSVSWLYMGCVLFCTWLVTMGLRTGLITSLFYLLSCAAITSSVYLVVHRKLSADT